jgi:hypothetical protein
VRGRQRRVANLVAMERSLKRGHVTRQHRLMAVTTVQGPATKRTSASLHIVHLLGILHTQMFVSKFTIYITYMCLYLCLYILSNLCGIVYITVTVCVTLYEKIIANLKHKNLSYLYNLG